MPASFTNPFLSVHGAGKHYFQNTNPHTPSCANSNYRRITC